MAKQAKIPQTEWTRSGMDISRTSVPLYQEGLQNLGGLTTNPRSNIDAYLTHYYGPESVAAQDFNRQYVRNMGNVTANNYAATQGGYTSSGQRAYDDQQRYMNDLQSRLYNQGISNSMAQHNYDVNNQLNALGAYHNAYGLGQNYSQIEQQNALADQANRNWLGNLVGIGGTALGAIAGTALPGVGTALGAQLGSALGNAVGSNLQTDVGPAMAAIYGGNAANYQTQGNAFMNPTDAYNILGQAASGLNFNNLGGWWNRVKPVASGTKVSGGVSGDNILLA